MEEKAHPHQHHATFVRWSQVQTPREPSQSRFRPSRSPSPNPNPTCSQIKAGANLDLPRVGFKEQNEASTALEIAVQKDHSAVVWCLSRAGADLSGGLDDGIMLYNAASRDCAETVRVLMMGGAPFIPSDVLPMLDLDHHDNLKSSLDKALEDPWIVGGWCSECPMC